MRPSLRLLLAVVLPAALASGCQNVEFSQKRHLGDKVMAFEDDPAEVHFHQKVYYSREGSAGGIGASAGGGCGCY